MADELALRFTVQGLDTTKSALRDVQESAKSTAAAVAATGEESTRSSGRMREAFGTMRRMALDISSALAGAAAIASIFAKNNEQLKRSLEVASLALSGLGTSVRAVTALTRLLVNVIGVKIAALGAVAAAVVFLVRNWDQALAIGRRIWQNFTAFLVRLWGALVETAKGLGQIIAGVFSIDPAQIQAGVEQFRAGAGQLRAIAVDVGSQIADKLRLAWGFLTRLFGDQTKRQGETMAHAMMRATQAWMEREQALADTIQSTSAKLAIQQMIVKEAIQRFEQIRDRIAKTREDKIALQQAIDGLRNSLLGMNEALRQTTRAFEVEQALAEQRRGERQLDMATIDAVTAAYRRERDELQHQQDLLDAEAADRRRTIDLLEEHREHIDHLRSSSAQLDQEFQLQINTGEVFRQGIEKRVTALGQELDLIDDGLERRRQEKQALDALIASIQAEIVANDLKIAQYKELGILYGGLIKNNEDLARMIDELRHRAMLAGKAIQDHMLEPFRRVVDSIRGAFEGLFTDIMSGAKSFGESILDFFRNVVNAIINLVARYLATTIVRFLFPLFGFAKGGIVPGGLALQHGGIVNRPTLAVVGEGRQSEAVVPLPDNRSIPVSFTGRGREQKPQEIIVKSIVLLDRSQMPRTDPDEIIQVVVADIRSRGPIERVIRKAVGGR